MEKLAEGIVHNSEIDPLGKLKEKVQGKNLSFKLRTVTEMEVSDIIRSLKKKTSHGFDGINSGILKLSGQALVAPLRYIINKVVGFDQLF